MEFKKMLHLPSYTRILNQTKKSLENTSYRKSTSVI